jgi:hypothetical protein
MIERSCCSSSWPSQRRTARACAGVLVLAVTAWATPAAADPQWNAGIDVGVAGRGIDEVWAETAFWLGARGDVLLGREGTDDFGAGPYLEVGTLAFDELDVGAGASLLLPVLDSFPLVVSFGPYLRAGDDDFGVTPGLAASLFWGTRSYDHHGAYEMAGGLLVQARHGIGEVGDTAILIGAHLDALVLALPFLWLGEGIAGPSDEAAPIEPIEPGPSSSY